jgi:uncharacterized membrane protein YecN with MAPEG domain
MTRIPVTLFTSGILGLLSVVLAFMVTLARIKTKVMIGDGSADPKAAALLPVIRAHGNFIEYVPLALILLGGIEVSGANRLTCEIFAALLIIARVSHAIGMYLPAPNPLRAGGALLTWAIMLGLGIEALLLLSQQPVGFFAWVGAGACPIFSV